MLPVQLLSKFGEKISLEIRPHGVKDEGERIVCVFLLDFLFSQVSQQISQFLHALRTIRQACVGYSLAAIRAQKIKKLITLLPITLWKTERVSSSGCSAISFGSLPVTADTIP